MVDDDREAYLQILQEQAGTYGLEILNNGDSYLLWTPNIGVCPQFPSFPAAFHDVTPPPYLRVAAFILEQDAKRKSPVIDHLTTVDAVEQRAGLDFFWQMPDGDEAAMENADNAAWAGSWVH